MGNVINIGSANIVQFGFQAKFDLLQKVIVLDISGQTIFQTGGQANVPGVCFNITGPGGLVLASVDFTAPPIVPANNLSYNVPLPGVYGMFGFYTIQAQIKDADGKIYSTSIIAKEITQPDGYNNGAVAGKISIDADCNAPQLFISEETIFAYQGLTPTGIVKSGLLSYPRGTLADLAFTATPFSIVGAGKVYTGRYTLSNTTQATFDLGDGIIVSIPYIVNQFEKVVDCASSLSTLLCCIEELKSSYDRNPFSVAGKAAKAKLDEVQVPFYIAIVKNITGQDASDEISEINKKLSCDCGCGSAAIEPKQLIGNGFTGTDIQVTGVNAASVTSAVAGSTKSFSVKVKTVTVSNTDNDDSFSITKTENDSNITYGIVFNLNALALNILDTINGSDVLTGLLKNIAGAAAADISLDGLNANCVIALSNCNYSIIEDATAGKVITAITINNTVHNAPSNLAINNPSGILAWLNGLDLGTFTASYDSSSSTTTIGSLANPNKITQLLLSVNGSSLIRQFTRVCFALVDVLNAITAYLCELDATKIAFGITGVNQCSFDVNGAIISTPVLSTTSIATLVSNMLVAQCALFNKINAIALTCNNVKGLFTTSTSAIDQALDFILGTKGQACARLSMADLAGAMLAAIAANPSLQAAFCNLAASCVAPTCPLPTNVSAVLVAGPVCTSVTNITGSVA